MTNNKELNKIKLRFGSYIPNFVLNAPMLKDIFLSQIHESYHLQDYIKRAIRELTISTATEISIDGWEKLAGLNNKHLDVKNRIDLVIKKFSLKTHANHFNFTNLLKDYDETIKVTEVINEYKLDIKIHNLINYTNLTKLINTINAYKPAHIGFNLTISKSYKFANCVGQIIINKKTINAKIGTNAPEKININNSVVGFVINNKRAKKINI